MKRMFAGLLVVMTLFAMIQWPVNTYAMDTKEPVSVEYMEDGSSLEIYIEETESFARTQSKSGKKTAVKKNAAGDKLWSVTVTASYTYDGKSAKCTSSSVSTASYSTYWKKYTASASRSGASGTASATFKKYENSKVTDTRTQKVTLTCSASGKLS